jgi:hypothetical protein
MFARVADLSIATDTVSAELVVPTFRLPKPLDEDPDSTVKLWSTSDAAAYVTPSPA